MLTQGLFYFPRKTTSQTCQIVYLVDRCCQANFPRKWFIKFLFLIKIANCEAKATRGLQTSLYLAFLFKNLLELFADRALAKRGNPSRGLRHDRSSCQTNKMKKSLIPGEVISQSESNHRVKNEKRLFSQKNPKNRRSFSL